MNEIFTGDCRAVMRDLIAQGVRAQMCVTSPPYWMLRDYGADGQMGLESLHDCLGWATGDRCGKCHVCRVVEVFALVRDVLADDGTLWVNYGDCYASAGGAGWQGKNGARADRRHTQHGLKKKSASNGLKPKDLVGIPWRIALALQADGWYLRQDIVWHKTNPMPESVRDRPTRAHEYLFLLSKNKKYYYDADAIAEPCSQNTHMRISQDVAAQIGSIRANGGTRADRPMKAVVAGGANQKAKTPSGWDTRSGSRRSLSGRYKQDAKQQISGGDRMTGFNQRWRVKQNESFSSAVCLPVTMRNKRSVWKIPTQPYGGAHFATFPEALVEPCVLAGSRTGDIVLDPFVGSGTVCAVAELLGRQWIGIDINPDYAKLARMRTMQGYLQI